jgi:hypothetical protein
VVVTLLWRKSAIYSLVAWCLIACCLLLLRHAGFRPTNHSFLEQLLFLAFLVMLAAPVVAVVFAIVALVRERRSEASLLTLAAGVVVFFLQLLWLSSLRLT